MRKRISAVVIDPNAEDHDYSLVNTKFLLPDDYFEHEIELKILKDSYYLLEDLNDFRSFDCFVMVGNDIDINIIEKLSNIIKYKTVRVEDFDADLISKSIVNTFSNNINSYRNECESVFSIFTSVYNTPEDQFVRLYESLKNQTYTNWDWYILDDSTNDDFITYVSKYKDPRITIIRNYTNHGVIGFNKNVIANACDGEYLVEVDHDDELTPDCLEYLSMAFRRFPQTDFVYSDCIEDINGQDIDYGEHFMIDQGSYRMEYINEKWHRVVVTPNINQVSIRTIYSQPNHIRCWKASFYKKIGGHNKELSVLDDMDLLIRTFLHGNMTKVNKVLYIQYEGNRHDEVNGTTQAIRFKEIQRTCQILKSKYDPYIKNRFEELGINDVSWDYTTNTSNLKFYDNLTNVNNILYV